MAEQNQSNIPTSTFQLGVQEHPLSKVNWYTISTGVSVADVLAKVPDNGGASPTLLVNGVKEDDDYYMQSGDQVVVTFVPAGLEAWAAWEIALLVASAVFVGGYIAYEFLPDYTETVETKSDFERISGLQNQTPLYKPFPAVLGKRKVAPVYISRPYTKLEGDEEYLYALLSAGYGPLKLENFRFGSIPVSEYGDDVEILVLDHFENTDKSELEAFWDKDIFQENVKQKLEYANGFTLKSTAVSAGTFSSLFIAANGIYRIDENGNRKNATAEIRQDVQDENNVWWSICREQGGAFRTARGYCDKIGNDYYLWTTSGDTIQSGNPTWLDQHSVKFTPGNYSEINQGSQKVVYLKNVDTNTKVVSVSIRDNSTDFKYYNLVGTRSSDLWPTSQASAINIRTRLESPTEEEIEEDKIVANITWDNLQTVRHIEGGDFDKAIGGNRVKRYIDGVGVEVFKPTVIGIKVKATGQLNGSIDNFYCDATMVVPQDKSADWTNWTNLTLETSTNPADAYKWVMQGPMNFRPVPHDKIDEDSLADWRSNCNELYEGEKQWTISAWVDNQTSLLQMLSQIAYVGRAEFSFNEGKFGVIEKIEKTVPKQIFTPRNSSNFQSKRTYPEVNDGVKVKFNSSARDYEQDEIIFNDPTKTTAELKGRYNSTDMWGVDNYEQAFRLARFGFYEQFLRRELYNLTADAESLVCKRGDLVFVQNDVINVGTSAGRIKSINGNQITLDETIGADDITTGGVQIRNNNGGVVTTAATYLGDGVWNCTDIGLNTQVGDLVVYGELGQESLPCIVSAISYDENMVANITLYNAANEVFNYDDPNNYPIPVYNSNISVPVRSEQPVTPVIAAETFQGSVYVYVATSHQIQSEEYKVYVQVRAYPDDTTPDDFFINSEDGWYYVLQAEAIQLGYNINGLSRGSNYQVRAQYRTNDNKSSLWSDVIDVTLPLGDSVTPVSVLSYTHRTDGTYLIYNAVTFPEFDRYEVRTDTNFGVEDGGYVGSTKDTSFFLGLITTDDTYYIAARNSYGAYSESSEVLVQASAPSNPTGLNATAEGFNVRLSWSQVADSYAIQNYEVRYTEANVGADFSQSIELGTFDALSITHTTSSVGTYVYYVRAVDIAGQVSDWVNTDINVSITAGTISDKLDDVESAIDDINLESSDLRTRVFNLSDNVEKSELEILRSFTEQAASREDLRFRIENDEKLIDAAVYIDPLTGQIINRAYAYTDDSFSEAQVLIDGVDAKVELNVQQIDLIGDDIDSLEGDISNINAELLLIPGQITATATTIVSEAVAALEPAHTFNFYDSAQGWVAVTGTLSATTPNEINVTLGDIENDSLSFDAQENPLIRMAITRTAGTGWVGDVIIERDDTTTETFPAIIEEVNDVGVPVVRSIDFRGVTQYNGTINRVRLILGDTTADEFDITQIVIGKPDAYAQELDDITARITTAELDINSNTGQINQVVTDLQTFEDETDDKFVEVGTTIDALEGTVTTSLTAISGNRRDFEEAELDRLLEEIDSSNYRASDIDNRINLASAIDQLQVDVSEEGALAKSIEGLQALTVEQGEAIEANTVLIQQVETNVDGNAEAIIGLQSTVSSQSGLISATGTLLQENIVDTENNASSITTISSAVTGETDEAQALIKLESYLSEGGLAARAFFGIENGNRVTGIVTNDDGAIQQMEFIAQSFSFLDANGEAKVYFDTSAEEYVFEGTIYANSGVFSGTLTSEDGNIGGWSITANYMASSLGGARIELDANASRISVFDTTEAKVVMGYLEDLPKNDDTGNWTSADYGFWARKGDHLVIDGSIGYTSGDFAVQNNASLSVYNSFNQEIVRLGSDSTEKGLFLYDDTGNTLAAYTSTGINIGNKLTYDTTDGLIIDGEITSTSGNIGGWELTDTLLRSAESGARIELNPSNNRVSIFDATNEKVAMGYLNGLPKYDNSGNWGANDYGFWARQGDNLVIDGSIEYVNGDFLIENDASLKITTDDVNEYKLLTLGTDSGEKGLFIYDGLVTENLLAKFTSTELYMGNADTSLSWDTTNGLNINLSATNSYQMIIGEYSNRTGLFFIDGDYDDTGQDQLVFELSRDKFVVGNPSSSHMSWSTNDGLVVTGNITGSDIDATNTISGANGYFSGTVYAKEISGDVVDVDVGTFPSKTVTTSTTLSNPIELFRFQIGSEEGFSRVLTLSQFEIDPVSSSSSSSSMGGYIGIWDTNGNTIPPNTEPDAKVRWFINGNNEVDFALTDILTLTIGPTAVLKEYAVGVYHDTSSGSVSARLDSSDIVVQLFKKGGAINML